MKAPLADEHGTAADQRRTARSRPEELEDWLNRHVYHPLSWRLALLLARTPASPNMVSISGAIAVVLAAYCYAGLSWPASAVLGLAIHMFWHVLDGADGDLARLTDRVSTTGEFVDGLCDYLGHVVMYLTLASLCQPLIGAWAWPLGVFAGICRAVQTNFFESLRRNYEAWAYGRAWLGSPESVERTARAKGKAAGLVDAYLTAARSLLPQAEAISRLAADPASQPAVREAVAQHRPLVLAGLWPFGSNYRTLALGAAMMVQMPILYLLYEAVLLNLVLAWSVAQKRQVLNRMIAQIGAGQQPSTAR